MVSDLAEERFSPHEHRSFRVPTLGMPVPPRLPVAIIKAEEAVGVLLKRDHIRTGQRYGVWFQGLVRQIRIARIQDVIETDGRLVVAAG